MIIFHIMVARIVWIYVENRSLKKNVKLWSFIENLQCDLIALGLEASKDSSINRFSLIMKTNKCLKSKNIVLFWVTAAFRAINFEKKKAEMQKDSSTQRRGKSLKRDGTFCECLFWTHMPRSLFSLLFFHYNIVFI